MTQRLTLRQQPLALALCTALSDHRDAVLQAPTGAGKSTLVPLALLDEPIMAGGKILMLEPRRVAARAVAARMAQLLGERVGETVGYRMRMDTRVSRATRIEVVTEGVMTRLLQDDPALEGVACLIFDEYHERSLQADLALALALDARRVLSASFRIVVMSATIEAERVVELLGDAAIVSVPGRAFAVDVSYVGQGPPALPTPGMAGHSTLPNAMAVAIERALHATVGDVLAFLPGAGEIRRTQAVLTSMTLPDHVDLLSLYGEMSAAAQDEVLTPTPVGRRRVVLATNIAETSLTIPGVTAVVDSGLVRRSRFDPASGMSRLELMRISRPESEQRAGRAGRLAPGICVRLWSEGAHARLAAEAPPEILDSDLAPLALDLARWGTRDATQLSWLNPPPRAGLAQGRELLQRLDALDSDGRLTAIGQAMGRLPLHPRLGHMLLSARRFDAVRLAAELAALLSERDLLRRSPEAGAEDPDIRSRLEILQGKATDSRADRFLLQRVRQGADAIVGHTRRMEKGVAEPSEALDDSQLVGGLLALAYPDRVAARREGRYVLANGRGARFSGPVALAREEFLVAVNLDDRDREARIDLAAPLSRATLERLFAAHIVTEERFGWDAREAAVVARLVRRMEALVLEDKALPKVQGERAVAAMVAGLRQLGIDALPWDEATRALQARLRFVSSLRRAEVADWPASDDATLLATLEQWLVPYLDGITRRDHLARVPLGEALRARLNFQQLRTLELLAPREFEAPTGSQVRIDYADELAPSVSVRLQEVFGLAATPCVGGGAVPLTFKLLSPARRPVQITRDLAGFWRGAYTEVRKDLRGRYPRHFWPENPWEAAPTRGVRR